MPQQQTHVSIIRRWLQSLGVLTAVSISREEAEMKLAAYVPMLMHEGFPDAAFTSESLNAVARQCIKGFPTYPELADHLARWWRENRPAPPALPPPAPPLPRQPPTPEELERVHASVTEIVRALAPTRYADQAYRPATPRYLAPELLDRINPLPNGRKRAHAVDASAAAPTAPPSTDTESSTDGATAVGTAAAIDP